VSIESNVLPPLATPHYPLFFFGRTVLKNGDTIRLQHQTTKKYLHSHLHVSPLSGNQEVSCYGPSSDTGVCLFFSAGVFTTNSK
jgi:MIR domain-containing protein